ncbi:hypothetical protein ACRAWF_39015 [Streptomyces sp. L7]
MRRYDDGRPRTAAPQAVAPAARPPKARVAVSPPRSRAGWTGVPRALSAAVGPSVYSRRRERFGSPTAVSSSP